MEGLEGGPGSVFHFTVRMGRVTAEALPADAPSIVPAASGAGTGGSGVAGGRRILLAEDNPVNQKVALHMLRRAGYDVTVVATGREALDALARASFDLVLMDVQMPEMDGFAATAAIRRAEVQHGGHVPIIAMTAHSMAGDRERCLGAGMDGYLSKPIRSADLYAVLERELAAGCRQPAEGVA
jgi:CheY-like chemotaxis protein